MEKDRETGTWRVPVSRPFERLRVVIYAAMGADLRRRGASTFENPSVSSTLHEDESARCAIRNSSAVSAQPNCGSLTPHASSAALAERHQAPPVLSWRLAHATDKSVRPCSRRRPRQSRDALRVPQLFWL